MTQFTHKPVLAEECIAHLSLTPGMIIVDGTLGLGGHSELVLKHILPNGILIGIDKDRHAINMAKKRLKQGLLPVRDSFHNIKDIVLLQGIEAVDGILIDLGVSSYQLDDPTRGFSYMEDGPLDMRMDPDQANNASLVVNTYSKEQLIRVIREYGEERWAKRIAEFIVERRKKQPIETTFELVDVIKAAIPAGARKEGPHPAKRTFQAIRIEVNEELDKLPRAIEDAVDILKPGGRICMITFHSLEDRIVKHTYRNLASDCICPPGTPVCICDKIQKLKIITRQAVKPSDEELELNPRARSAKLRVAERVAF